MMSPLDPKEFPKLAGSGYTQTSPPDIYYNCIAHAAGDQQHLWWPDDYGYWPPGVPRIETLSAFVQLFRNLGYELSKSADHVEGVEKVALFVDSFGWPTHAARQLPGGRWTSKVGRNVDIEHDLAALEGPKLGFPRFCRHGVYAAFANSCCAAS